MLVDESLDVQEGDGDLLLFPGVHQRFLTGIRTGVKPVFEL